MARGARSLSTRTAGLLLALAFALIAAGVILVVVVRGQGSGAGLGSASSDLGVPVRPPESGRGVQGARDTRVQFADRHDPSRVASELQWATLDPRERGRADVTEPRAWVYFKDGRVGHVKAQRGQLYMPEQGKHPETGTFVGGVLGRVFGPRPPGDTRPIDPETDTPEVLFFAETIEFNMPMGSITTSDEFRVESSEVTFRARGLVLHWNEVRDRVELFQTDGNNSLQYVRRPGATNPMQHRAPPAPESASVPGTGPAGAAAQAPRAPRLDFYKAVLAGHVELAQNQRLLTSDNLDLWVRLVDRRLAPGALGPATPQAPGSAGDGAAPPPPPPAETGAELAPAPADAPTGAGAITLSWSGPLTVRPMEAAPPELARDDVALRFTADGSNTVGLRDTAAGLTGACAWLAYGATSRLVTLAGRGPVDVRLADARGSAIESDRVEIAVAARTAHVPGAGRLLRDAGSDRAGAAPPAITWREQADFVFEPGAGTDSWRLREALLAGSVAAQDGPRALRGESFHAYFAPAPDGRPLLGRLVIQEQAVADGQSAGSLRASRIDIAFAPPAGDPEAEPEPVTVTAHGSVVAAQDDATLRCGFLEAALARNEAGELGATIVRTRDEVGFTGADGVGARSPSLTADVPAQTATLEGPGSAVWREPSLISGANIGLDGARRRLEVVGAGTFAHAQGAGAVADAAKRLEASWSQGMTFDDAAGRVECTGDVVATSQPDELTIEVARAGRAVIDLDVPSGATGPSAAAPPGPEPVRQRALAAGDAPRPPDLPERTVRRVELFGSAGAEPSSDLARVESRRYALDVGVEGGRRLERFVRLTGGRIVADEQAGTLTVPGPGRAATYDGRTEPASDGADEPEARGSSLFTWTGSMVYDRNAGLLELARGVRLVHKPLEEGPVTTLEADNVRAWLTGGPLGPGSEAAVGGATRLGRAVARNSVYVTSGPKQLVADLLTYDAATHTIEAVAEEGNVVRLFDETAGPPVTARRLIWDLRTDRVDVREMAPVVAPR